jgi:ParB/Sulfiredoxin domain
MTVKAQSHEKSEVFRLLTTKCEGREEDGTAGGVTVPVNSLSVGWSPRLSGEDPEHIRVLAAAETQLPPILVHRPTMRVIDGVHRLRAVELRGEARITAQFFSGDEEEAFVVAVKSNTTHGLPLSLADRRAAAARIVSSRPQWSDRMIASITGLSSKTVAEVRRRRRAEPAEGTLRIGRDGRIRPTNGSVRRLLASELMTENPELSLRQVARAAGISPETARDVRNRLRRGEDPVSRKHKDKKAIDRSKGEAVPLDQEPTARRFLETTENLATAVGRLRADPALRFSETGRTLLRLLHMLALNTDEWEKMAENVPLHCSQIVAQLARECSQIWSGFAEQVDRKLIRIT